MATQTHRRHNRKHAARNGALYTWTCTCGTESTGGLLKGSEANKQWTEHRTETTPREVECVERADGTPGCGQVHPAEFSHYSQHGGHAVWAVVCTSDYLTDYYTEAGLK